MIRILHSLGAMVVRYIVLHNLEFITEANHYLLTRDIMRGLGKLRLYQSPGYAIGNRNKIYIPLPMLHSRSEGNEMITNGRHTGLIGQWIVTAFCRFAETIGVPAK